MSDRSPILNRDAIPWESREHGAHVIEEQNVSLRMPARKLSYGITRIPPGAKSFPLHFHHANEECFIVLAGTGQLRYGGETVPLRAGDVITCPAGPDSAHQFINDGAEPLEYLAIGTMQAPDLAEYPDSQKVNIMAGSAAGGDKTQRTFGGIFRKTDTVDYWEGEA
jgi:uncharacterized cupin superfamily protein